MLRFGRAANPWQVPAEEILFSNLKKVNILSLITLEIMEFIFDKVFLALSSREDGFCLLTRCNWKAPILC